MLHKPRLTYPLVPISTSFSEGKWQVRVQTGPGVDHGTSAVVSLTICGEHADSGSIDLGGPNTMQRGGQEDFEVSVTLCKKSFL